MQLLQAQSVKLNSTAVKSFGAEWLLQIYHYITLVILQYTCTCNSAQFPQN